MTYTPPLIQSDIFSWTLMNQMRTGWLASKPLTGLPENLVQRRLSPQYLLTSRASSHRLTGVNDTQV